MPERPRCRAVRPSSAELEGDAIPHSRHRALAVWRVITDNRQMTDAFTAIVGNRRGNGQPDNRPRFRDPPASDCSVVTSLADFNRRLRVGVVGVLDLLDEAGRVVQRERGTVVGVRAPWSPYFRVETDAGVCIARYPTHSTPPECQGPTWRRIGVRWGQWGSPWRFTFLDESNGQEPLPRPAAAAG